MRLIENRSQKEIDQDKKIILQKLKQGVPRSKIALELNEPVKYVSQIIRILVNEDLISHEDIEIAKKNSIKVTFSERRFPPIATENQTRKEVRSVRQKKKNEFYNGIRSGKTPKQMEVELKISKGLAEQFTKELSKEERKRKQDPNEQKKDVLQRANKLEEAIISEIEAGQHSLQEVASHYNIPEDVLSHIYKKRLEDTTKSKNESLYLETLEKFQLDKDERETLKLLFNGYEEAYIAQTLNSSEEVVKCIIKDLQKNGAITADEIEQLIQQKRSDDEKEIIYYLKIGYRQSDIMEKKPEYNYAKLHSIVLKLQESGRITAEEINRARTNAIDTVDFETLIIDGYRRDAGNRKKKGRKAKTTKNRKDNHPDDNKVKAKVEEDDDPEWKLGKKEKKKVNKIFELIEKGLNTAEIATYLNMNHAIVETIYDYIMHHFNLSNEDIEAYKQGRSEIYSTTREKAKTEMEKDSRSVGNRRRFMDLAKKEVLYGNDLSQEDVVLLGKFMILNDKFLSIDNLKLVIMQYTKLGELRGYK